MKRRHLLSLTAAALLLWNSLSATSTQQNSYGIVNFAGCVNDSKLGKREQASFESLKKQMASVLENTEKQLTDLNNKFNDPEYLDGLSPEAESELKTKMQHLNDELNHYQSQYYQVLNQANARIVQLLSSQINTASEEVAKEKKLVMVINKEACFFSAPQLEITSLVVEKMDKLFDEEEKKLAAKKTDKE